MSCGADGLVPRRLAEGPRSVGRTRRFTACYSAAAAHADRRPNVRRWSATSGRVRASCCTWTPSASAASRRPGTVTGDRRQRSRRVGWEFVHSVIDDCSPAGLQGDPRRREGRDRHRVHRRALDWFLDHGMVAERLMTDNAFTYVNNRSLRELLHRARSGTCARGPTRPAPMGRSSATSRLSNANGPTRSNTPQAMPAARHCHTGPATTTSDAPTAPSATARRSCAFGTSPGSTSSYSGGT